MSSQVLALKYRPRGFGKLIGQEAISTTLSLALKEDRLSHAYLFSGIRGSGKTSTARIFAKALVCEKGPIPDPCEQCIHCEMSNENRHIDIIEMDAASSRKIDDIRDLIEQVKYKPNTARYKIFIIDEVHMLTREAFNALLKTLEEPPPYVKFILATTDPLKLPATILSRTQHFRFKNISDSDILHHLIYILNEEKVNYEEEALKIIARSGNGSLRDTLTLLDQAILYSKGNIKLVNVTKMLGIIDPTFIDNIFGFIFDKNKKRLIEIVEELKIYECNSVLDEFIIYLQDKFFVNDARFSLVIVDRFFRILNDSKFLLSQNANASFVLMLTLFKMLEATSLNTIDEMILNLKKEIPKQQPTPSSTTPIQNETNQPAEEPKKDNFQELIAKLYDRNYELGTSFENNVVLGSHKDNTLTLNSSAEDNDKNQLRQGYGIIKQFVQEIYGIDTNISVTPVAKPKPTNEPINEPEEKPKEQNIVESDFVQEVAEKFRATKVTLVKKIEE
ncbi:MAG: DNA polymerase III subunits gamma and tau (EC [uncultured Campylobacterales bacterium]|uniref:DNA polymerase III subunit gamma/tau n=1 Tax=uncultured Campylobacterales bacterium TaxID=352960 RepID=A0A6S6STW9_9BACT|nr:MAG: DNA polymerase III subunits gamma and tau (EC [uncultured Campylobacterales bacterium]